MSSRHPYGKVAVDLGLMTLRLASDFISALPLRPYDSLIDCITILSYMVGIRLPQGLCTVDAPPAVSPTPYHVPRVASGWLYRVLR